MAATLTLGDGMGMPAIPVAKCMSSELSKICLIADMLKRGISFSFKTDGSIDCHIGFFWGDTPYENKMWHQILPGNLIGPCFNNANKGEVRQSVVLIK